MREQAKRCERAGKGLAELEWEVEASCSGAATLRIAGRFVESQYRPQESSAAAARQILAHCRVERRDLVILIGAGLGYLIEALGERDGPALLVWDPFPELRAQLEQHGCSLPRARPKRSRKLPVLRYARNSREFDENLAKMTTQQSRAHVVIHPGYESVCRFEARYLARALRRRVGVRTTLRLEDAIVSNRSFRSLRNLPFCRTTAELAESLVGQTAIIASAGPSLAAACEPLSRRAGGALFACIQALDLLARGSAHVDFATCADARNLFAACKVDDSVPYDALLADTSCQPGMIESRLDRTFLFHLRTPSFHQIAWQACQLPVIDEPCLTISEVGLLLAHSLGARRFILVGVDFDSDDERYRERFRSKDMRGEATPTNSHYFHASRYLNVLCPHLASQGAQIYRLGRGLPIEGTQSIELYELEELLADLKPYQVPPSTRWVSPARLAAVEAVLAEVRDADLPGDWKRDAAETLSFVKGVAANGGVFPKKKPGSRGLGLEQHRHAT